MGEYTELGKQISNRLLKHIEGKLNNDSTQTSSYNLVFDLVRDSYPDHKFVVVCDETNNTKDVIAYNRFVLQLYIREDDDAPFTCLDFKFIPSRMTFDEIMQIE